ncbi:unnamed protein product [Ectocarpus sp. 8 AP-2014]
MWRRGCSWVGTESLRKRAPIDGENRLQDHRGARLADGHTTPAAGSKRKKKHAYAHAARSRRI